MAKSIRAYTKVNRPAQTGVMVGVRLQPDQLAKLDEWRAANGNPSRPEAVRVILSEKLR